MSLGLVGRNNESAHSEAAWCCAFGTHSGSDTSEEVLVTGALDESVRLFATSSEGPVRKQVYSTWPLHHSLGVASVDADQHARAVATSLDSTVRVWHLGSDTTQVVCNFPATEAWGIKLLPSDLSPTSFIVARGSVNAALVYEYNDGIEKAELKLPTEGLSRREAFALDVALSADGTRAAVSQMGGGVSVFDVASGDCINSFRTLTLPVRSVALSGDTVLASCDNGEVHALDARTGSMIEVYNAHPGGWCLAASPHPGGKVFATGGTDGCVRLWELGNRQPVQSLHDFDDSIWGVVFNDSGSLLGACSEDCSVAFYYYT